MKKLRRTKHISADTLEREAGTSYLDTESVSGNYAGTLIHEYGHTNEGTAEQARLDSFLAEDEMLFATAEDKVLGSQYGISAEDIKSITEKLNAGEKLTAEEQEKITTYRSEMSATMAEHYLGNERVVRKLVLENEPLVERMLGRLESFKKTLAGKGEKYSAAEKARIDKALKLYEKAAEAAGNRDLVKRILALRDEDEDNSAENEHLSKLSAKNQQKEPLTNINQENMHVSSFSQDFADSTFNSFGITKPSDYIHVQRKVFDTLLNEEFFTNTETRSRTDINAESGMVIETNKSSISETFNENNYKRLGKFKKIAKLTTVRILPEIIKNGKLIADNVPNKYQNSANKTFAYISYDTEIDGVPITVKLDIKKSPAKNKLWVHSIITEKNSTGQDVFSKNGIGTPYRTDAIGDIVPQDFNSVNSETKFSRKTDQERSTLTKGEAQKQRANYESDKVYTKAEIAKMVESLNGLSSIPKRFRTEIVNDIWTAFNSRYSPEQRERHSSILADKIFARVMQESGDAFDNTSQEDIYAMEREIHSALKKIAREGGAPSIMLKIFFKKKSAEGTTPLPKIFVKFYALPAEPKSSIFSLTVA